MIGLREFFQLLSKEISSLDGSLPCLKGRVGVELSELASSLKWIARLRHPTLTLPHYT